MPLTGIHLLVAEDNEMNQFVTSEILRSFGMYLRHCRKRVVGRQSIFKGPYNLILMDFCQMPEMDGLEATHPDSRIGGDGSIWFTTYADSRTYCRSTSG